jgi:UDP-N-acetylglucosamine diphosphorylase/glucosamine-1-phosphate N-acetyltransferase
MRICLFEDRGAANLEPLSLTRPVFELLCGQTSLGSKQCRHFAPCDQVGVLVRPHLASLYRAQHPSTPTNQLSWLRAEPTILVNGRWLPPAQPIDNLPSPCVGLIGDEVAYAIVGPDQLTYCSPNTLEDCLETWKGTLPHVAAEGCLVNYLWELVDHNAEQLRADFPHTLAGRPAPLPAPPVAVVGPADQLWVDPSAELDPLIVADTRKGPVVIDRDAVVTAFSRLEGPCYVGPGTHVLGAKLRGGTTLGPGCRVGGEIEASIILGHSNKYHDGFLGHSYVGEWVNLGAGTNNSDLRNDYGEVTVTVNGQRIPTGRNKVGCFLGDHTKSGLSTQLNTGTNAGAFCNLLPAGLLLPKYVPSFCSCWNGELVDNADLARLLRTAAEVMARRGHTLTETHAAVYRALFDQTAAERRRTVREQAQRQLRRSA